MRWLGQFSLSDVPTKPQQRRQYVELCKRLREWRLEAELSQRELSKRLKRPLTYASKVESRVRRIDPVELADWARVCGVDSVNVLKAIGLPRD